ncbi:unnamed protein product [Heterobilharzia americana]|nr:unnamed protein product [Heterobilharzia americana]
MSISNVDELYEKTSDVINQLILLTKSTKYDDETFNKSLQLFFDISNSIKASIDITSYHIKVAINILSKPSIIRNLINIYRELGRKAIPLSFTPVINSQSLSNPLPDMKWIFTFINFQQILTTYISVSISFTQIIMKSDIYLTEVRRILNRSINIELFENIDSLIESIIFGLNTSLFYEDEIIRTRVIDYCLHNILMHYIHSKNWRIQMNTAHFLVFITYTDISQLHINEIEVVIESLMKYFISLINEGIKDDEFNYIRQFNKVLRILALNSKYRIILIVNGVVNYLNLLEKILPNDEEEIFLTLRIISSEISTDNAVEEIKLLAKKNYDKITSLEEELRVVSSDVCNDAEDEDDNISPPVDTGGETNYTVHLFHLSGQYRFN